MCLAIPSWIVDIDGHRGIVDIDGIKREASLLLIEDPKIGGRRIIDMLVGEQLPRIC